MTVRLLSTGMSAGVLQLLLVVQHQFFVLWLLVFFFGAASGSH